MSEKIKAMSDEMMEAITGGAGPNNSNGLTSQRKMKCDECTKKNGNVDVYRMFTVYSGGTAYCEKCGWQTSI